MKPFTAAEFRDRIAKQLGFSLQDASTRNGSVETGECYHGKDCPFKEEAKRLLELSRSAQNISQPKETT